MTKDFWVGFGLGVGAVVAVVVGVSLMGCDTIVDVMVEPGVVNKVEEGPPQRPPLPEGWRSEGGMWINDLTGDTL
jgi:hypothetical protein